MATMTTPQTINGVPIAAILKPSEFRPDLVQYVAERKIKAPDLDIVEPDPRWTEYFQVFKSRILTAFSSQESECQSKITVLSVNHVGSTSVPNLPAKAVIDIDLVLSSNDLSAEAYYVPRLEAAGFHFRLREPAWHEHRFFYAGEPVLCNLHVWGPQCPEVERHRIFGEWLRTHGDDRELYAKIKTDCAALSREKGEAQMEYNSRKEWVIREILMKAFKDLGLLGKDGE